MAAQTRSRDNNSEEDAPPQGAPGRSTRGRKKDALAAELQDAARADLKDKEEARVAEAKKRTSARILGVCAVKTDGRRSSNWWSRCQGEGQRENELVLLLLRSRQLLLT